MIKSVSAFSISALLVLTACNEPLRTQEEPHIHEEVVEEHPKEMLREAYQLFKEGDDSASVALANRVLEIGKETQNDTLVGRALTSLCRNSQRKQDTMRLAELSQELIDLAETSGDQKWVMYQAHMNAEMWRLIGDMDKAEAYYDESMRISFETGATGMYTIDHFNLSFVAIAKGDFEKAQALIKKYYQLRREADPKVEDAYGLIALAYLLEQHGNYEGAHEVAVVTRRLFKEQNLFPEPPDEKPLLAVEAEVKAQLEPATFETISAFAASQNVTTLLEKYLP
jgi:tetratricopeptide (TPR) repeat protein